MIPSSSEHKESYLHSINAGGFGNQTVCSFEHCPHSFEFDFMLNKQAQGFTITREGNWEGYGFIAIAGLSWITDVSIDGTFTVDWKHLCDI